MNTQDNKLAAHKKQLRARFRQQRLALGDAARAQAAARICQNLLNLPVVQAASTIFSYVSTAEEVATGAFIDACVARGQTVLVPRIVDRNSMYALRFSGWDSLRSGAMGIMEPPMGEDWLADVDCAIVPGLAFSHDGLRLGYGGGYYDRWLAQHPETCSLGVCFGELLVSTLPAAEYDRAVTMIVTAERIIDCSPA